MLVLHRFVAVVALAAVACSSSPASDAALALAGTSWTVAAVAGTAVMAGSTLTLTFGEDGKVTGNAGCNQYFASWAVDGDTLTIGLIGASKMFCAEPDGLMAQEGRFLEALGSVATGRRVGDQLELASAAGAPALTLTRS
jgi:heat shock protein HslJ